MTFNTETAKEAGKISKRGSDSQLKELREVYSKILDENTDNIQTWLKEVAETDPAKALDLLLKIGSFVIPKPRTIELKQNIVEQEPTQITFFKTYDED